MINPYFSTDRNLKVGFKINLDNHHNNHANSELTITAKYPEFGIEIRCVEKIIKELSFIYARIINHYKLCQTVFSARFDKQDEVNQVLDETELFINLIMNHILTENDLDKTDVKSPIEHQRQQQEMKESGWRFDKINSMIIYLKKTGETSGSSYFKIPLRSAAFLNFENDDKYCFIWSIVTKLHPCIILHPNGVPNINKVLMN